MNAAHLHLILNHIPVIGAPIALALLAAGIWRRSEDLQRAGLLLAVLVAVAVIPVSRSGEAAEDLVESLDGVNRSAVHPHEERAEAAQIAIAIAGGLSFATLVLPLLPPIRRKRPRWLPPQRALVIFSGAALAIAAGLLGSTAWLGGAIRHTEIQMDSGAAEHPREDRRSRED